MLAFYEMCEEIKYQNMYKYDKNGLPYYVL